MTSSRHPVQREYLPAPVCHGGGFVFPELNDGIPWFTPSEWERMLEENDIECEWPECESVASTLLVVEGFTPFLCALHSRWCESGGPISRVVARRTIKDHLTDKVLVISYGSPRSREPKVSRQLSEPYVPFDQRVHTPPPQKREPVRVLSLPKLGQNTA